MAIQYINLTQRFGLLKHVAFVVTGKANKWIFTLSNLLKQHCQFSDTYCTCTFFNICMKRYNSTSFEPFVIVIFMNAYASVSIMQFSDLSHRYITTFNMFSPTMKSLPHPRGKYSVQIDCSILSLCPFSNRCGSPNKRKMNSTLPLFTESVFHDAFSTFVLTKRTI